MKSGYSENMHYNSNIDRDLDERHKSEIEDVEKPFCDVCHEECEEDDLQSIGNINICNYCYDNDNFGGYDYVRNYKLEQINKRG